MQAQDSLFSLEGKVALITGAAQGIGAATAKRLAKSGAKVMVTDIQEEKGQGVVSEIKQLGGEALFLKLDTTNEENWESVIQETVKSLGGLDILVNNAGIFPAGVLEATSYELFQKVLAVNLCSPFLGMKHAIPVMKPGGIAGRGGSIINLSSTFGMVGYPGVAAYAAAKGGIRSLSKTAAVECATFQYNIRVNSLHPGTVNTDMPKGAIADFMKAGFGSDPEALVKEIMSAQPLGVIEPEDVAGAVLYLASDASKMVTGTEFVIDGGLSAK